MFRAHFPCDHDAALHQHRSQSHSGVLGGIGDGNLFDVGGCVGGDGSVHADQARAWQPLDLDSVRGRACDYRLHLRYDGVIRNILLQLNPGRMTRRDNELELIVRRC